MIDHFAARVRRPAARLRFLRRCGEALSQDNEATGVIGARLLIIQCLIETTDCDVSTLDLRDRMLLRGRRWAATRRKSLDAVRRYAPAAAALFAIVALGAGFSSLSSNGRQAAGDAQAAVKGARVAIRSAATVAPAPPVSLAAGVLPPDDLGVWLVESDGESELYSNGLSISNAVLRHTEPRRFLAFPFASEADPHDAFEDPDWRTRPVGVVYHTTVSETAPPLARENKQLIRERGEKLIRYVAKLALYHFLIDRFGRVHRLIPENEVAYHAGYSMWRDKDELYVNLNNSFIGVAFESRPEALEPGIDAAVGIRPAQITSAGLLTEMLRERFGIPAQNCVTHEMVSLNPELYLIGYHTDWAGRFPFAAIGLPDNYELPLPSVSWWGFGYDSQFVDTLGGSVWSGVARSVESFQSEASSRRQAIEDFREERRRLYRRLLDKRRAARAAARSPTAR